MNKQSKNITQEKDSSKNLQDINGGSYVFVKYSELMALQQSANDASIALYHLASVSAGIKLMSLRPEVSEGLSQKLTAISDTKRNTQSLNRISEPDVFGTNMERTSKSIDSPLLDSTNGRTRKSRRK
jgi:hypothetical protein